MTKRPRSLSKKKKQPTAEGPTRPQNPYKRDWQREAWDKGWTAAESGASSECPLPDYPKSLHKAWELGFKAQREWARVMAPPAPQQAVHQSPPVVSYGDRRFYRQDDEPEDQAVVRNAMLSCPNCKRKRLDDMRNAVRIKERILDDETSRPVAARLRCKACGETWKLPYKVV